MNDDIRDAQNTTTAAIAAGEALAVAGLNAKVHQFDGGIPYRVTDDDKTESLEAYLSTPIFRRGQAQFYDAASFAAYVNRFKDPTSLVFADAINRKFTALLDYHAAGPDGAARWRHHRAELALRHTPNWATWVGQNKKPMTQADFAQFLEDNLPDIAEPAGGKIVEIARTLEAKSDVQFESHIRADNGAHTFQYAEQITGSAGRGTLTIPSEFLLVLQPFEGSERYQVSARFRYRISNRALSLWFDLVRIEDVLKQAFSDEQKKIEDAIEETDPAPLIFAGPAPVA